MNNNPVSETSNVFSYKAFDSGTRFLPYSSESTNTDLLNNVSTRNTVILDEAGNLTSQETEYLDGSQTVVKETVSEFSGYNSFGKPTGISVTNTRNGESVTRSKTVAYDQTTGLLLTETAAFGSSPSVVTTYSYDDLGNQESVSVTSGTKTWTGENIWEQGEGRFMTGKVNVLGDTVSYSYDKTGSVISATGITGLVTTYTYDGMGNIETTTLPGDRVIQSSLVWSQNSTGKGDLYYLKTESAGKPTTVEYFDMPGRSIRTKIQGFDGTYLVKDTEFDSLGRKTRAYEGYFEGSPVTRYTGYQYDDYNRIAAETIYPNNAETTYSYDPLQVTISRAGQTYVRQSDASGLLHSSSDPGGTISYVYNPEDKIKQITSPSGNTVIGYDDYGYQSSLEDIDAGTIEYTYNAFGELESQTDAKGNEQTLTYDALGRALTKSWNGGEAITYVYNPVNRMIKSISSSNGTGKRFEYDELNRLRTRVDSIDNNNKFTASYSYLSTGEIGNVVLNSAVTMSYEYNTYGYVDQVRTNNHLVWDANSMNRYGVVDNFTLGNQVNTVISYDQYGFVDGITSTKNGTYLQNWSYDFNNITGNLTSRMGLNSSGGSVTESFTYDDLNRLLTCTAGQDTLSVSYDESGYGNITGKTDVGTYDYTGGVHNVTSVTEPTELMQNLPKQFIDYTKSGKVSCITDTLVTDEVRELNFIYGPDENRVKTLFTVDDAVVRTKYFALDQYEKETDSTGNVRELYYISGADGVVAVLEKKNNQDSIFYIHKDYLGSYDVISNQNGTVKERYNFDPWGRRRNPADWSYNNIAETNFLDRGFTGHEHLDKFGLINMNGRVYDPLMAMFLSPDNFVQSPDLTRNFNRYSYCLNNPLTYIDPSGMTYFKLNSHWQWESFEYNPFMGDNFRTVSGGGINPERLNGTYRYNRNSGQYENNIGERVTWDEVYGNYVVPNTEFTITWLYFAGTKEDPYQSLTGYDTSDGTKVRFFNNASSGGGAFTGYKGNRYYFEGVRVRELNFGNFKHGAAMTVPGVGIFVGPGGINDVDLLKHEFGHILQARKWGAGVFYGDVAPASLRYANYANSDPYYSHLDYMSNWTEWSANYLSYKYFQGNFNTTNYPISPVNSGAHIFHFPHFVNTPSEFYINWLGD